jgi:isocitrate dehydrogenase
LHGALLMLVHIGQADVAERIHNAWLRTLEEGIHTYDIFEDGKSKQKVGTKEFAEAVAKRVGQKPEKLKAVSYAATHANALKPPSSPAAPERTLVGVDVYVEWPSKKTDELGELVKKAGGNGLELEMMSNRGTKVWPKGAAETFCTDGYRCRFMSKGTTQEDINAVVGRVTALGLPIAVTFNLRNYEGKAGYTLAQGQ